MIERTAFFIGAAGEAFVRYDLLRRGINCAMAAEGTRGFDLFAASPQQIITIQVKAACNPTQQRNRADTYYFKLNRFVRSTPYIADVYAFVALDIPAVLYYRAKDLNTAAKTYTISPGRFMEPDASFERCFFG